MHFTSNTAANVTEVRMTGRWEFTDHERLHDIVRLIGPTPFVLDLRHLEFIDSAGLGMLLILGEAAQERNIDFKVKIADGDVRRAVALARIDTVVATEYVSQ